MKKHSKIQNLRDYGFESNEELDSDGVPVRSEDEEEPTTSDEEFVVSDEEQEQSDGEYAEEEEVEEGEVSDTEELPVVVLPKEFVQALEKRVTQTILDVVDEFFETE